MINKHHKYLFNLFYGICEYSFSYIFLTGHPYCKLFVRLFCDFTASLKHLKPVWKYDPFNTWAKEIMASFRTRYDTFILLWLLFSFFKYTQSIFPFGISLAYSLNYYYWWTLPKGNKDKVFMANTGTYTTTTITSNQKWFGYEYFCHG